MIDKLVLEILLEDNPNQSEFHKRLINLYNYIVQHPQDLDDIEHYEYLGECFLMMIDNRITSDIEHLKRMINIGYLCLAMAYNSYQLPEVMEKLVKLLNIGKDSLVFTIMKLNSNEFKYNSNTSLLELSSDSLEFNMSLLPEALERLYYLEFYYLDKNERTDNFQNIFSNTWKRNLILENFSSNSRQAIDIANATHFALLDYLSVKIIENGDLKF